jgi:hypothetical protein
MSLLRFGQALGQTLRGLPENQLVRGGLGLMSANAPGQRTPVDQPGSFLKGMLSANALRQNRLLQEEQAKERERQEAQRLRKEQAMAALMPTLNPRDQMMLGAFGDNSDVIKSIIARQNPQPPKYENVKMDKIGNAYGVNMNTGQFELIPTGQQVGQAMPINAGEVVDTMPAGDNVGRSAAGFVAEAPLSESERRLQNLQIQVEENKIKDRQLNIEAQKEKETIATKTNAANALRTIDAVSEIQNILDNNPEGTIDFAGPTGKSSFFSFVGGTDARNVDVLMNTIAAAFGFSTLAEMRAASPTGGALGAINEKEMELLINSVIALDQGMSRDLFEKQLGKISTHFTSVLDKTPDEMLENLATGPAQSTRAVPNKKAKYGYTIIPLRDENGNEIRIIRTTDDGEIIASNGVAYK